MHTIRQIRSAIGRHLINFRGWQTNRKIVVFESDDWGSIRIPTKEVFYKLQGKGIDMTTNPFNRFDALETEDDLVGLFELLSCYHDKSGNYPIITANFVVANPAFDYIKRSGFQEYYFELIEDSYNRFKQTSGSFQLIKEGMEKRLFKPQYHGREHLNVAQWMMNLRSKDPDLLLAFENGVFGIETKKREVKRSNFMAAFDYECEEEKQEVNSIIRDGYDKFLQIFQFRPLSMIAPCNTWHPDQEVVLNAMGIKYIQGLIIQYIPQVGKAKYKIARHYHGQGNRLGQQYLVRNCYFEPSTNENYNWVGQCLKQCHTAFLWGKPAIISMHRVNMMGGIFEWNRKVNLIKLSELIGKMLKRWPEIEFMSSDQLGSLMSIDKS